LGGAPIRVLVTARRGKWPPDLGLDALRLDVFAPGESRTFLRGYLDESRAPDEDLDRLGKRLYHLPLALELAGRYLERHPRLAVAGYLDKLETVLSHRSMQAWRADLGSPTDHDLSMAATFAANWDRVGDENARRLFLLAGYCAPNQPIPYELLSRRYRQSQQLVFGKDWHVW
jgi:hypothetical protein